MKYVLIENRNDEIFGGEFDNKDEAIKQLIYDFNDLSYGEKKHYSDFYVLESENPDKESENHFDGNYAYVIKVNNRTVVMTKDDSIVDYDIAVNLMDDDIRESVHSDLAPCTNQEFFDEYCKRHFDKFGKEFQI